MSMDQPELLQAVREFHGRVMAQLQAFGKFTNGALFSTWISFDREQSLMLLGRYARALGGVFAEAEELPQRVAKRGQVLIF